MVKVREDHALSQDGTVDLKQWLRRLEKHSTILDPERLLRACRIAFVAEDQARQAENIWSATSSSYLTGLEMAVILSELKLDEETLVAAVLYRAVREGKLELGTVSDQFGPEPGRLIEGVLQMAAIHYKHKATRKAVLNQTSPQPDNVRRMLVNMIDDVRVALIKIAERTCAIRAVKHAPAAKKYRVAREVFDVYAPLAHRLGIGRLKWELEDLSFRYIEPTEYKRIARLLDEKRLQRESYIQTVVAAIESSLQQVGLQGYRVHGRVKHIYSIWRKMKRKNVAFSQVYDIRAVRVLLPETSDCYRALGLVHSMWRNIPKEFDDYIATPKENGYQSLHTAVIGPEGKVVEIQLRTFAMDEDAELGVCAHWRYKGSDQQGPSQSYEEKIEWLRQVLEWHETLDSGLDLAMEVGEAFKADRIYLLTPEGHVVDLPNGARPLDFAYRIHTDIGHSCRAVRVNGQYVPLTYELKNGDQVEILTGDPRPNREWMDPALCFITTSSARAKVESWFKALAKEQQLAEGRLALHLELYRHGLPTPNWDELAQALHRKRGDDLLMAYGRGEISATSLIRTVQKMLGTDDQESTGIEEQQVLGVGQHRRVFCEHCQPLPGDPISGLLNLDGSVHVHRRECSHLLKALSHAHLNPLHIEWGPLQNASFAVELKVLAWDRTGLLRDVLAELAALDVNVQGVNTVSDKTRGTADMHLQMDIPSLDALNTLMHRLSALPNIIDVQRLRGER